MRNRKRRRRNSTNSKHGKNGLRLVTNTCTLVRKARKPVPACIRNMLNFGGWRVCSSFEDVINNGSIGKLLFFIFTKNQESRNFLQVTSVTTASPLPASFSKALLAHLHRTHLGLGFQASRMGVDGVWLRVQGFRAEMQDSRNSPNE